MVTEVGDGDMVGPGSFHDGCARLNLDYLAVNGYVEHRLLLVNLGNHKGVSIG
jgi:hypothetical protein